MSAMPKSFGAVSNVRGEYMMRCLLGMLAFCCGLPVVGQESVDDKQETKTMVVKAIDEDEDTEWGWWFLTGTFMGVMAYWWNLEQHKKRTIGEIHRDVDRYWPHKNAPAGSESKQLPKPVSSQAGSPPGTNKDIPDRMQRLGPKIDAVQQGIQVVQQGQERLQRGQDAVLQEQEALRADVTNVLREVGEQIVKAVETVQIVEERK